MKKYYSLREISNELGIPKSTIVKYKDYYSDFLKMAGDGKRKKFEEDALEVLRVIRELREDKKLDWMEIKDALGERFGAPAPAPAPSPPAAVALQPAPSVSAVKIEYLSHMVLVIGAQLLSLRGMVEQTVRRSGRNGKNIVTVARHVAQTERKLDLVLGELLSRDGHYREKLKAMAAGMRKDFDRLNVAVQHLSEEVAGEIPDAAEQRASLAKLEQKIDKLVSENAMSQSRHQVLLRENEMLKNKLRESAKTQPESLKENRRGGLMSIFRRD